MILQNGREFPEDYRCDMDDCFWIGHPPWLGYGICGNPNYVRDTYPDCYQAEICKRHWVKSQKTLDRWL